MGLKKKFASLCARSRFSIMLVATGISLLIFSVLRMVFYGQQFADINEPFYEVIAAFLLGIISDLIFLSYFFIPFAIYLLVIPDRIYRSRWHRGWVFGWFFIALYSLFFSTVSEWFFWNEFGVRFNFISVDYLVYTHEVINNIIESYPLPALLFAVFLLSVAFFRLTLNHVSLGYKAQENFLRRLKITGSLLLLPLISYSAVGQDFHHYSDNKFLNEIAANGPYQFFAAFRNNEIAYRDFYRLGDDHRLSMLSKQLVGGDEAVMQSSQLYDVKRMIRNNGEENRLNVILITIESLSAEYLAAFGNNQQLTPFMNGWFKQGLLFSNFYATGTRTTRGLEALTLSIPPTPGRSIVKRPDNAKIFNIGRVFQQRGYDTVFLYGGNGYFDNMSAFYSGNGFRIVDKSDLSEQEITFSNAWGVSDDIVYRRTLKEADTDYQKQQPFFFQIMTTSNHRPFTYPDGKIDIPSGSGGRNGGVKFTDYALREFIEAAQTKRWFRNTLFVVVADHCAGSARRTELPVDRYHIPLFIYAPEYIKPKVIDTLSSQIDVAPTLLGLLNFSYESQFYGRNILQMQQRQGRALIGNYQKLGLYKNNKLVYLSPQQKVDVVLDPLQRHIKTGIDAEPVLVSEDMAYYQSADYIWRNRLNRYQ